MLKITEPDTKWLTGTFVFDGATGNRLLAELPPVIAFEGLRERGYEWFDVSYRMMAKERRDPTPGAAVMISRILDLMYIQMLRATRAHQEVTGAVPTTTHSSQRPAWPAFTSERH